MLRDEVSEMPKNWNRRFKHNRDKIKTGDIYELAEVVRNLSLRESEKGLSTGEKQMFTRTKKILASELMYALDKDEDEAESYLDELLADSASSQMAAAGPSSEALAHAAGALSGATAACATALQADGRRCDRGRREGRASRSRAAEGTGGRGRTSARSVEHRRARRRGIDQIVLALPPGSTPPPGVTAVDGGAVRSDSVRRALAASALGDPDEVVGRARRCQAARDREADRAGDRRARRDESLDAAIAAAPVTDTVKRAERRGLVRETLTARSCGRCRPLRCSAARRSSARWTSLMRSSPGPPTMPG